MPHSKRSTNNYRFRYNIHSCNALIMFVVDTHFLCELRTVTCLFVNLKGLSLQHDHNHKDGHNHSHPPHHHNNHHSKAEGEDVSSRPPLNSTNSNNHLISKINDSYDKVYKKKSKVTEAGFMQVHKALFVMQSIFFHYEGVVRQFLVGNVHLYS
jgi:hypothetical protein